jgi:hypothetical protein
MPAHHNPVDKFFIIIQTLGNFMLPIAGVFVGLCAVSKKMQKWIKKTESAMKQSTWKMRLFGLVLIAFCSMYLWAMIRANLSESAEKSPIYQGQMVLKNHVKNFARNLIAFAKSYTPNNPGSADSFRDEMDDINSYAKQLKSEGVPSDNLEKLFDKSYTFSTQAEQAANWIDIANELNRMADMLPKNE